MAVNAMLVLKKEMRKWREAHWLEAGFSLEPCNDSIMLLKGKLRGPIDSPYDGGKFEVMMGIPPEFPHRSHSRFIHSARLKTRRRCRPPIVNFETKIWHPNVDCETMAVSFDMLGQKWTPTTSVRSVLESLRQLLAEPQLDYAMVPLAGQHIDTHTYCF